MDHSNIKLELLSEKKLNTNQSIYQSLYVQTENDKTTVNSASIPYNTSANNWGKRINLSFSQENVISRECIYAISISR